MYDLAKASTSRPLLFRLVAAADHVTPITGASPTVTLSKNGAAFASPAGAVTELANGWYKVAGNATDTDTAGPLVLYATAATADPCTVCYQVGSILADDAHGGTSSVLSLSQLRCICGAGPGIYAKSLGPDGQGNSAGMFCWGYGSGPGLDCEGGTTGNGIEALGGGSASGVMASNNDGTGPGVYFNATTGAGLLVEGGSADIDANLSGSVASVAATTNITVVSPVATNGTLTITQGDSYDDNTLTAAFTWTLTDLSSPTSVTFRAVPRDEYNATGTFDSATPVTCTMTVLSTTYTVTIPLTSAYTDALSTCPPDDKANYVYQITVLKGGKTHTLAFGSMTVKRKVG